MAPVQEGALRADAALTQHLALLWVQRAQQPILARLRGLTGCHTRLVYGVAGTQEGCRDTMGTGLGSDPRKSEQGPQSIICASQRVQRGLWHFLPSLDQEAARYKPWPKSNFPPSCK